MLKWSEYARILITLKSNRCDYKPHISNLDFMASLNWIAGFLLSALLLSSTTWHDLTVFCLCQTHTRVRVKSITVGLNLSLTYVHCCMCRSSHLLWPDWPLKGSGIAVKWFVNLLSVGEASVLCGARFSLVNYRGSHRETGE